VEAVPSVLNLGCGRKHRAGAVNLDRTPASNPDVVHDLDVTPWPFADNRFDQVYAFDVIEHLADVVAAMEELHRICRNGASIEISVPHFSSGNAFTDPTHRHFFSRFSFDYFDNSHEFAFYSDARFRVVRSSLIFARSPLNRLVSRLANRYPRKYEARWAWMFPAWFLSVELKVLK
jgi:SAM-dependent methyltransferase